MNYLAHIYLADNNEKSMLGNFLGDFVNKSLEDNYETEIKNGIFMHRKLDSFTDSNPIFLESKKRISSGNRRFAGVLIDMFYDHFLAKNWAEYSKIPLEEFVSNFYDILERYNYCLPDKLTRRMSYLVEENWLLSYKEIDGIKVGIDRIANRFAKTNHPLIDPIDELIRNYNSLEDDFKRFFPLAMEFAQSLKG
ncbi:MAG: ACP phosphodiesterase [Clostridiaceae bacterium]